MGVPLERLGEAPDEGFAAVRAEADVVGIAREGFPSLVGARCGNRPDSHRDGGLERASHDVGDFPAQAREGAVDARSTRSVGGAASRCTRPP